jgi:F-type H+-transporting ATPase subunit gamma
MEELERAQDRLQNIRGVKPILGGLRTISLGSWQAALQRRNDAQRYAEQLQRMLPSLLAHLPSPPDQLTRLKEQLQAPLTHLPFIQADISEGAAPSQIAALVIGSERGLCGRFNTSIAEHTERYLSRETISAADVTLMSLGNRASRALRRRKLTPAWNGTLSVTTLPSFSLTFELTHRWLTRYEGQELDAVDVIHNAYRGTGTYEPTVTRLIPPALPLDEGDPGSTAWPPPIIETDPLGLYATIIEQWTAVAFYNLLLDSVAAEHSTRFQLMESATQNADRLIDELTLVIQTARQQAITQEMQELAIGAGMIGE